MSYHKVSLYCSLQMHFYLNEIQSCGKSIYFKSFLIFFFYFAQMSVALRLTDWQSTYPMDYYANDSLGPWTINNAANKPPRPPRKTGRAKVKIETAEEAKKDASSTKSGTDGSNCCRAEGGGCTRTDVDTGT